MRDLIQQSMIDADTHLTNIADGLIATALFTLGAAAMTTLRRARFVRPARHLWRVRDPSDLLIVCAAATPVDTGQHVRPTTGIGQLRAAVMVTRSLRLAYRSLDIQNVLLSDVKLDDRYKRDLIILGGPWTNAVTRDFLAKIDHVIACHPTQHEVTWKGDPAETYEGTSTGTEVKKDYGVIIRMQNPMRPKGSEPRTVVLLFGCHTYGTIAAATYFTEEMYRAARRRIRAEPTNYAAIVKCDVQHREPVCIELVRGGPFSI